VSPTSQVEEGPGAKYCSGIMKRFVFDAVEVASRSRPQMAREVETPVSAVKVVATTFVPGAPVAFAVPEIVTVPTT
jgi:hypothetical protein